MKYVFSFKKVYLYFYYPELYTCKKCAEIKINIKIYKIMDLFYKKR